MKSKLGHCPPYGLLLLVAALLAIPASAQPITTSINPLTTIRGLVGYCTPPPGSFAMVAVTNTGTSASAAFGLTCLTLGSGFATTPTSVSVNGTTLLLAPYTCAVGTPATACVTASQTFTVPQPPTFNKVINGVSAPAYIVIYNGSVLSIGVDYTQVLASGTQLSTVTLSTPHAVVLGDVIQIW